MCVHFIFSGNIDLAWLLVSILRGRKGAGPLVWTVRPWRSTTTTMSLCFRLQFLCSFRGFFYCLCGVGAKDHVKAAVRIAIFFYPRHGEVVKKVDWKIFASFRWRSPTVPPPLEGNLLVHRSSGCVAELLLHGGFHLSAVSVSRFWSSNSRVYTNSKLCSICFFSSCYKKDVHTTRIHTWIRRLIKHL